MTNNVRFMDDGYSTVGTLKAIENQLKDEVEPLLEFLELRGRRVHPGPQREFRRIFHRLTGDQNSTGIP